MMQRLADLAYEVAPILVLVVWACLFLAAARDVRVTMRAAVACEQRHGTYTHGMCLKNECVLP